MILTRSLVRTSCYLTSRYTNPALNRFSLPRASMASLVSDVKEVEVMDDSDLKDGEK